MPLKQAVNDELGIEKYAKGGWAMKPGLAQIAENEPELVIPKSKLTSMETFNSFINQVSPKVDAPALDAITNIGKTPFSEELYKQFKRVNNDRGGTDPNAIQSQARNNPMPPQVINLNVYPASAKIYDDVAESVAQVLSRKGYIVQPKRF